MAAIYEAAVAILKGDPRQVVILDGRTFLRAGQVQSLLERTASLSEQPRVLECVCEDAVARQQLERDQAEGRHLAGNRSYDLYRSLKATAEPLVLPRLVLDTGRLSLEECVRQCMAYLKGG